MATKETRHKPVDMHVMAASATGPTSQLDIRKLAPRSKSLSEAKTSQPTSPRELTAEQQIMSINRRVLGQIETLRLKVEVDARQHDREKNSLRSSHENKLKVRELEIEHLKTDLGQKESAVANLTEENSRKSKDIRLLQQHIDELRDDVEVSKSYTDEIQKQLDQLHREKTSLESGSAYKEKDEEIQRLQSEVGNLKKNLLTLEKELEKSKEKICQQGGKIRLADMDRGNARIKFKEELAKVTQTMRNEVERMREVMLRQWEEMRELREQNEDMRSDIKEIRQLLTAEVKAEASNQTKTYVNTHSPYNVQALTPSLPTISRDTNRLVHGKKKK